MAMRDQLREHRLVPIFIDPVSYLTVLQPRNIAVNCEELLQLSAVLRLLLLLLLVLVQLY
jgi:hypothetical protein